MATRREFIHTAAAVGATLATSRALGANDRIRLGVIGSGGRGLLDMLEFLKNPGVEVTAVCDVWDEHRDKGASQIPNKPKEFQTYVDYRRCWTARTSTRS